LGGAGASRQPSSRAEATKIDPWEKPKGAPARVRRETPQDAVAIRAVNEQAFDRAAEADLIEALRRRGALTLSLVALQEEIVGHIAFSPVTIHGAEGTCPILGLGSMAVTPARQRQGIGSLLVREGLAVCRSAGWAGVVVPGHPEYYLRFGFVPAGTFDITCEYPVPDEVFMALELIPGALSGRGGIARYRSEFSAVCRWNPCPGGRMVSANRCAQAWRVWWNSS
jgi:putative acetyltransferase